jgi:hypothetical protein
MAQPLGSFDPTRRTGCHMLRKLLGRTHPKALPDPRMILWVAPSTLNSYSDFWSKRLAGTPIMGGNWDLKTSPIAEHPTFRGLYEHFKNGVEWRDAAMFNTPSFTYLHRPETFDAKCRQRDALYQSIVERGLLPDFTPEGEDLENFNEGEIRNILIHIGRDGELIFAGRGWHRLSIAKILDLQSIPVQVLLRHRSWQKVREEVAATSRVDGLRERTRSYLRHPDLLDLVSASL